MKRCFGGCRFLIRCVKSLAFCRVRRQRGTRRISARRSFGRLSVSVRDTFDFGSRPASRANSGS
jgi:hypothetical protein